MRKETVKKRVHFDPTNKEHVRDYALYRKNSNWSNGCKYILERPFFNVPAMIDHKLLNHFLKKYTAAG